MAWPKVLIILAVLLTGSTAFATVPAPAELPPPDFSARQYIDSKGCVFLRDGEVWSPRQARDGTLLCGYPPTFSARRKTPDQGAALFAPPRGEGSRAHQIEMVLTEALITNLRPGELASDPRPITKLPDMGPEPAPDGPIAELRAEMAAKPTIAAKMGGGLRPNQELCHLLGYDGGPRGKNTGQSRNGLGQDPSGGFCADLPRNDLARLAFSRPVPVASQPQAADQPAGSEPAGNEGAGGQEATITVSAPPKPKQQAPDRGGAGQAGSRAKTGSGQEKERDTGASDKRRQSPETAPPRSLADLVPPGARYVHIGAYGDPANAERAIGRLGGSGLPILKSRGTGKGAGLHLVIAGPFDSRQAVVMALDKIRKAGFRDSFAR